MVTLNINRMTAVPEERLFVAENAVDIWQLDLDAPEHDTQAYRLLLDDVEVARLERLRTDNLRRRYAVRRGVLRLLLSAYLNRDPRDVVYSVNPCGKPELSHVEASGKLYFNLSHSDGCAVYAMTRIGQVGVDVERAVAISNMLQVAKTVFAEAEQAALTRLPDEQQVIAFYNGWTRKEAVVKALGQGIGYGLASFEVSLQPGEPARLLSAQDERLRTLILLHIPLQPPYIAACAVQAS